MRDFVMGEGVQGREVKGVLTFVNHLSVIYDVLSIGVYVQCRIYHIVRGQVDYVEISQ